MTGSGGRGCNRETDKETARAGEEGGGGGGAATIYAIYGPTDVKLTLPKPLNRFHGSARQTRERKGGEGEHLATSISIAAHGTNMNHIINVPNQWANCHWATRLSVFPFSACLSGIAIVAYRVTYRPIDWHNRCICI